MYPGRAGLQFRGRCFPIPSLPEITSPAFLPQLSGRVPEIAVSAIRVNLYLLPHLSHALIPLLT